MGPLLLQPCLKLRQMAESSSHPALAKAAAQFLTHHQCVVSDAAACVALSQRTAALQEGMDRAEDNFGAQRQGGERMTENLVPPNQLFAADNAQL
jgi:hypothetical protein